MLRGRECYLLIGEIRVNPSWVVVGGCAFRFRQGMTDRQGCVRSVFMGSDGFESKKLGVPVSGGAAPNRLGTGEYSGGAARDPAIDALAGLGEAGNLVEISGVIKWFDASKGYGFIVPDNGSPDVLLHVTVLRRGGYQTPHWESRLAGWGLKRAKG